MNEEFIITGIDKVILVGKNEYPQSTISFTDQLKSHEIIYHFGGKSTVYFNGKVLKVGKDTIRFLPKGENREYVVEKKENGDCIDVFFDTDVPLTDEAFVINNIRRTDIGAMFKKLFAIWVSKNEGYYFECISLLYKIFAAIRKQNYIPENQYNLIKPAVKYIEENFLNKKISVKYLADICNISEPYLKKLFYKRFAMSPLKYIIQLKINHASDLLRLGRYSVGQVAELSGYESLYYFSRQFKEYTGITPSEFIEKYVSSK